MSVSMSMDKRKSRENVIPHLNPWSLLPVSQQLIQKKRQNVRSKRMYEMLVNGKKRKIWSRRRELELRSAWHVLWDILIQKKLSSCVAQKLFWLQFWDRLLIKWLKLKREESLLLRHKCKFWLHVDHELLQETGSSTFIILKDCWIKEKWN